MNGTGKNICSCISVLNMHSGDIKFDLVYSFIPYLCTITDIINGQELTHLPDDKNKYMKSRTLFQAGE